MHLLLSNDDGVQAQGLEYLAKALSTIADITVVAPHLDRSAASNSLTLQAPLRATEIKPNWYKVDGTPTDCVHLGITGLLDKEPDMVVSGMNSGPNLGDDVIYSGTVAAAMEGRYLGSPAVAISMNSFQPQYYQTGAIITRNLIEKIINKQLPKDIILNVNIPDVPLEKIKGIETTRLGNRHKAEPAILDKDPRGKPIYWVGAAGPEQDAGPGTDFYAVGNDYVSVTPLHLDLTQYSVMDSVSQWLSGCEINREG
ncbi:MAG: 5'/3'-nucleotidase SurE [Pseudomonadota bacterium]